MADILGIIRRAEMEEYERRKGFLGLNDPSPYPTPFDMEFYNKGIYELTENISITI